MVLQIVGFNDIDVGQGINLGFFDDLLIPAGVTLGSLDAEGVLSFGSNQFVTIAGTVAAFDFGLILGDGFPASNQKVHVADEGLVVSSKSHGIFFLSSNSRLINEGTVTGYQYGVLLQGPAQVGTLSRVTNTGVIVGDIGIGRNSAEPVTVINHGIIEGRVHSFLATESVLGNDIIRNRGTMIGDVAFGIGNDLYDGRGGTIEGSVLGRLGDDRFIPGASAETFDGGGGNDTLDFSLGAGITVSLDDDQEATLTAEGDVYTGIENIIGSRQGADKLYGSAQNNELTGQGGADQLFGGNGTDTLTGGRAADILSGGAGADRFVFNTRSEGGDRIDDFLSAAGTWDLIRVQASGFGSGLTAGVLAANRFESDGDIVTLSSTVRFHFRTTDKTLWFDPDGNGAEAPVLLADLQASATLVASDIVVF